MFLKKENTQLFNSVKLHLLVIGIFIFLTSILTLPVIFQFTTNFAGIGGDTWAYIWSFWWFEKALSYGSSPFTSQYMFYPIGINFTQLTPFNAWIAFLLLPLFNQIITWNILWFSGFILGGYGTFLLCNHFLKKFFPSLIAGIIFSFSSYHTAHALGHLELITISWIPFFILFLFRTAESNSKINPLLAGLFFFLVSMSSWYYSLFMFIFAIIFLFKVSLFSKDKKLRPFFIRYFLIFAVGICLSAPLLIPIVHSFQSNSSYVRPISEFYNNSLNAGNILLPTSIQTIVSSLHFPISVSNIEQMSYLGTSVLLFSFVAIIRYRNSNILFWTVIGSVFLVLSFGPELVIFKIHTGIPLPQQFLYNLIPGWSFFRDPSRFVVMVSLSTAILASHSISNISLKINSKMFRIIFLSAALFFILLEFATIPFPTTTESVPSAYQLIKDDPTSRAVLDAPIGGSGEIGLLSDPSFDYYQTIHEKPMYGGYLARVPINTQRYVQTYFLNQFVWYDEQKDIVKQNLKDVGISIFNYYNIGYVVIHKRIYWDWIQDFVTNKFVPDITNKMNEILQSNNTFYEDENLVVYKIPETKSDTPFVILGKGWHNLDIDVDGSLTRTTDVNSEIIIVNPTQKNMQVDLEMTLKSVGKSHIVNMTLNNVTLDQFKIPIEKTNISINAIQIKPGSNIIGLTSGGFAYEKPQSEYDEPIKASLQFYLITTNNILRHG
ncbi:MAG: hypothetical protein ACREBI_04375 [Nitrosotalea sp.]